MWLPLVLRFRILYYKPFLEFVLEILFHYISTSKINRRNFSLNDQFNGKTNKNLSTGSTLHRYAIVVSYRQSIMDEQLKFKEYEIKDYMHQKRTIFSVAYRIMQLFCDKDYALNHLFLMHFIRRNQLRLVSQLTRLVYTKQ